jgi:presenilin-like A22 family membrane protease
VGTEIDQNDGKTDNSGEAAQETSTGSKLPREITLKLVLPVVGFTILAQVLTMLIAFRYVLTQVSVPAYEPFGSSVEGSVGNSLVLVVTVFIVTIIMVWLIKVNKASLIRKFLIAFVSFNIFSLTLLLTEILLPDLADANYQTFAPIGLATTAALFVGYSSVKPGSELRGALASLLLAVEVAAYMAIFIRPPTIIILPVVFAIYDLYAVFMGPLKALISTGDLPMLGPLVAKIGDLEIGLGDIAFYSLLPASGFILGGLTGALLILAVTNAGLVITLRMLKNRKSFPGLPIPVLLGTCALLLILLQP